MRERKKRKCRLLTTISGIFFFAVSILSSATISASNPDKEVKILEKEPSIEKNAVIEAVSKNAVSEDFLSLDEAIKIAKDNSQQTKAVKAELESALAKKNEVARALWPHLYLEGSEIKGELLEGVEFKERKYGLSMEQVLYSSDHLSSAYKQAKKQYQAAKAKYDKVEFDLSFETAQSYYELAKAILNYRLQSALLDELEQDFKVTKEKFSSGVITEEELMEVNAKYRQIKFQRLSAKRDVDLGRYKFIQTLGIESDEDLAALKNVDTKLEFEGIDIRLDNIMDDALSERIELKIAQLMVEVGEFGKKIAKSKDDWKVTLDGFYGQSASYYTTESSDYDKDWNLVVRATKTFGKNTLDYSFTKDDTSPKLGQSTRTGTDQHSIKIGLLDNYARLSHIEEAQADYEKYRQELKETKKEIGIEAHQAYFDYQEAVVRTCNSFERVKLAQQRLSSTQYQMWLNQLPLSQVIDAKIKLTDEKSLYTQALADYKISLYRLDRAVGEWGRFSLKTALSPDEVETKSSYARKIPQRPQLNDKPKPLELEPRESLAPVSQEPLVEIESKPKELLPQEDYPPFSDVRENKDESECVGECLELANKRVEENEKRIEELTQTIDGYKRKLKKAKDKLRAKEEELKVKEEELEDTFREKVTAQCPVPEAESLRSGQLLEKLLSDLAKELTARQKGLDALDKKIRGFQKEIKEKTALTTKLSQELKAAKAKIRELKSLLSVRAVGEKEVLSRIALLDKNLSRAQGTIATKDNTILALQAKLGKTSQSESPIAKLNSSIPQKEYLEAEPPLAEKPNQRKEELEAKEKELSNLAKDLENFRNEIKEKEAAVLKLTRLLENREELIKQLSRRLEITKALFEESQKPLRK